MALINKIRQRTALVVGIVALGLVLFVLGNFIKNQSRNHTLEVGKIAGETISRETFELKVEKLKNAYIRNSHKSPSEGEMEMLRQQAWDMLISEIAFSKEYKKLGLVVTEEELVDMVQGNNINPEIIAAFTNPQTGQFEKAKLLEYLKNIDRYPVENQLTWYEFEDMLPNQCERMKYENLLTKSVYVTKQEAQQLYDRQNTKMQLKYLYVPFYSVSDSSVSITDNDLKEYLDQNREQYKKEAMASVEYISFSFTPSREDTLYYKKEMESLVEEFKQVSVDSSFAKIHSDAPVHMEYIPKASLPQAIGSHLASLKKGDVVGPFLESGSFKISKLSDIKTSPKYSMRASHILIKPSSPSPEDDKKALEQANNILSQIKKGVPFDQLAMIYGMDDTRNRGGDLGWFVEGKMVKEFEKAVINFKGVGLIPQPVKTEFGYHIIKVTEPKINVSYQVTTIERSITPSDETKETALARAEMFASGSTNAKDFRDNAAKDSSLIVARSSGVRKSDRTIGNNFTSREIVRWIFNEGNVGDVSNVFETDKSYVVVLLTSKTDDDEVSLENERAELMRKVQSEKKSRFISDKLKKLKGSLEEIAQQYGPAATVNTMNDVSYITTSLTNAGYAPLAIGAVSALSKGQRTEPMGDESGVLIVEVLDVVPAHDIADYSLYKNQIMQQNGSSASYTIMNAIKEFARIKDNRYQFY